MKTKRKTKWIRMPKKGSKDPEFGLSRSLLYKWRKIGLISTMTITQPGCSRGITYIERKSLLKLIEAGKPNHAKTNQKKND
jgi:hypothetical protein